MNKRDEIESILHLNGCQQRTSGYNEALKGNELDTEDMDRLESLTLDEVMKIVNQKQVIGKKEVFFTHTAVNFNAHLFIDGMHDPDLCPECIRPGTLVFKKGQM